MVLAFLGHTHLLLEYTRINKTFGLKPGIHCAHVDSQSTNIELMQQC